MAVRPNTAAVPIEKPNPGQTFKSQIQKAKLDGINPSALLLQLSRSDVSRMKRDRSLAISDIRFMNGKMHFLDVLVTEGEVAASSLVILQS